MVLGEGQILDDAKQGRNGNGGIELLQCSCVHVYKHFACAVFTCHQKVDDSTNTAPRTRTLFDTHQKDIQQLYRFGVSIFEEKKSICEINTILIVAAYEKHH